jgi:hypothetical protein
MYTIQALYEMQRVQIIIGYYNNPDKIDPSLVFSYENRIYPYFHESHLPGHKDLYQGCYAIEKSFIEEVLKYIEGLRETDRNEIPTFLELKHKFGCSPESLADIIRYAFLSGAYKNSVYERILSDCPDEIEQALRQPCKREEFFI